MAELASSFDRVAEPWTDDPVCTRATRRQIVSDGAVQGREILSRVLVEEAAAAVNKGGEQGGGCAAMRDLCPGTSRSAKQGTALHERPAKGTYASFLHGMIGFAAARRMGPEVGGMTGAAHGARKPDRLVQRNGYRQRDWQTRAGTVRPAPAA